MREIPFGKPIIGPEEKQAVMDVLSGTTLVHGPKAIQFEQDFAAWTGAPEAVSVSSCTAGMHLIYFHLGLGPGDEVLVPAQTHTATAHAVALTGATPVFVDADPETGNLDLDQLAAKITERSKAICVVHYLGMPVEMNRVLELGRAHGLFVLEDCALAVGSRYQGTHAGLLGDAGVFSFYPVKHMTTAEGGMIITRDSELAAALRLKKAFGVDRSHGERQVPGQYQVVTLGFNYRMSELHAAIGIEQIKRLDGFLAKRKENFWRLYQALEKIPGLVLPRSSTGELESSYYCLSVLLEYPDARAAIMVSLKEAGIGTSIYYPHPVPKMNYYQELFPCPDDAYPEATRYSETSIALPVGPHLDVEDMDYIAEQMALAVSQKFPR